MDQKGFTLIELMIVVAIIGIISAIAVPFYQSYVAKTQLTRAVTEVSSLKSPIERLILDGKSATTAEDLNFEKSNIIDSATFNVNPNNTGKVDLQVELGGNVAAAVSGAKINLTRQPTGGWSCQIEKSSNGGWRKDFIPQGCTE